ncbi:Dimethylaniline monooxygenase [N-oxide-forming] 2 [Tolypocladium ophioglossoides CBS 100239]|uniref:Dimethylaniline monooxygenase [N-oxide-forming] 2 n=1 Tax=Tolypocladium ophioglossoides (strain CBS 100239) TaxID=1163406 RepID=A0A0L0NHA0_TOLOC|nr:Dimethylaniline monooxygenase [N-oxide-forming] 2 [Tolypocladium ophioglossoides CBS 100239]
MAEQYGSIPCSPDYVQRLRELAHTSDELQRAGYILGQLSSSDLDRKRRCGRCCRVVKKGEKHKGIPGVAPTVASGRSGPPPGPEYVDRNATTAAAEEARISKESDGMFRDLTSGGRIPEKAAVPIFRCKFHPGRKWTCCNSPVFSKPCMGEEHHDPRQYSSGELEDNWRFYTTPAAPPAAPPRSRPAAAVVIDCEMGVAASGESELIRVSVIDHLSRRVLLDSLVWPSVKMAHFNTRFSGITKQMMDDARRRHRCLFGRHKAREAVWRLIGPETVVVGHAGQGDLTSLRWIHPVIVDTLMIETQIRRHEREVAEAAKAETAARKAEETEDAGSLEKNEGDDETSAPKQEGGLSLKALALQRLNRTIQIKGRGHDSVEDALATRDLLHWHVAQSMRCPSFGEARRSFMAYMKTSIHLILRLKEAETVPPNPFPCRGYLSALASVQPSSCASSNIVERPIVAVIGLGPLGLVTLKNLLEQDLDVTGFEKSDVVGGLWNFRDDDQTTVLKNTPVYPEARHIQQYLCDYAAHFALGPRMRLGTEIVAVEHHEKLGKWKLEMKRGDASSAEWFDKLVFATGVNKLPLAPKIEGLDGFEGQIMHSSGYKRPASLKDKNVLIIGFSHSAADTATTLVGHAKHVYISRRHDSFVISRYIDGKPFDHSFNHRRGLVFGTLQSTLPSLADKMMRKLLTQTHMKGCPDVPSEMDLATAPLPSRKAPIVSDSVVHEILAGNITLVRGVQRVSGPGTVMLEDGKDIDVDAIVFCTGYQADYSLAGPFDPTLEQSAAWTSAPDSNSRALPRLYRNIFSLRLPQSLAFMGAIAFASPAFLIYDLASMALAQVWSGRFSLPPQAAMVAQVDEQHRWLTSLAAEGTVLPGWVKAREWMAWADEAAGTDMAAHLGYGLRGWLFWAGDRAFCNTLMDGIPSPHLYRVFETGRARTWEGARDEIVRINSPTSRE